MHVCKIMHAQSCMQSESLVTCNNNMNVKLNNPMKWRTIAFMVINDQGSTEMMRKVEMAVS